MFSFLTTSTVFLLLLTSLTSATYQVPEPRVEVFKPRGLHVSIPDEEGIQLIAFHGNINNPIKDLEAGQLSKDVLKKTPDGRWTYRNNNMKLKKGDIITFWLYVLKDHLGYLLTNQIYVVQDLIDISASKKPSSSESAKTQSSSSPSEEMSLQSCQQVVDRLIESLKVSQAEVKRLQNLQQTNTSAVINGQKNDVNPTLNQGIAITGFIPNVVDDGIKDMVNFILWEVLNLPDLEAQRVVKTSDGALLFEMPSQNETAQVLEAAKKLKNSTIFIKAIQTN